LPEVAGEMIASARVCADLDERRAESLTDGWMAGGAE